MAGPPPVRRRSPASWSDIPTELASEVILRLHAHVDHVHFAAVCPQWRAAARLTPLPPPLPVLVLQDGTAYSLHEGEPPFHFPRCAANHTDASGNWLVFPRQEDCMLRNAFSDAVMTLPALSRVRARHVNYYGPGSPWMDIDTADGRTGLTLHKLLICSPHLIAALARDEERLPMPIIRIALCQPGASSWWCVVWDRQSPGFEDMVFHQGQLYAFDRYRDALLAIDIRVNPSTGDPWVSQTRHVIKRIPTCHFTAHTAIITMRSMHLVESCGGLLMVCRTRNGTWKSTPTKFGTCKFAATGDNEFEVFKPDFKQSQWTKVTTIRDDQVLFLCRSGCSRSLCVSGHKMQGDIIIFMQNDDEYCSWYDKDTLSSCRIYNMKDRKVSALLPTVSWKLGTVPGSWLFPHESGLK